METLKKFLIFSQKKAVSIFQEMELSYISGNENLNNNKILFLETELSYISVSNFPSSKNKKNHFEKMELVWILAN